MDTNTGWHRLKVGTILQKDDAWDYSRNRNDQRYERRDIPANRIGTKVKQNEKVDWYRFTISDE